MPRFLQNHLVESALVRQQQFGQSRDVQVHYFLDHNMLERCRDINRIDVLELGLLLLHITLEHFQNTLHDVTSGIRVLSECHLRSQLEFSYHHPLSHLSVWFEWVGVRVKFRVRVLGLGLGLRVKG